MTVNNRCVCTRTEDYGGGEIGGGGVCCADSVESRKPSYYATAWTARRGKSGTSRWWGLPLEGATLFTCLQHGVNVMEESRADCRATVRHCYTAPRHGCAMYRQHRLRKITLLTRGSGVVEACVQSVFVVQASAPPAAFELRRIPTRND
jgi:hypothetical protein